MSDKLVTLAVLPYTRAEVLKGRLDAKGIESFIANEHAIRPTYPDGVRIRIREADTVAALPIALHLKEEYALSASDMEVLSEDIEQILVPIDFSEHSYNAFEYAFNIAVALKADIKLLHVFFDASVTPVAAVDSYAYHVGFELDLQEVEQNAHQEAKRFIAYFDKKYGFGKYGITISYELLGGATEDSILTYATDCSADVIVMGTKGVGSDENMFFGSITESVLEHASIPVLAVPVTASLTHFPDELSVLFAANLQDTDYVAFRKLMRLLYVFNVKIHCMHVQQDKVAELETIRLESLQNHLQAEYPGYEINCLEAEGEDVVTNIKLAMAKTKIDFVALTSRKRGLFEELFSTSVSQKVLANTQKPVLVFHA